MSWYTPSHRDSQAIVDQDPPEGFFMLLHHAHLLCASSQKLGAALSFESLDHQGNALNLGETVLLEEEIPLFTQMLVKNGVIISALHNHWLFAKPHILYIHFQSVEPPLAFAQKAAEAFHAIKMYG